jgi:hypothetical protein
MSPPSQTPRKGSQFAGAAAMFRRKESDLLQKQGSFSNLSPKVTAKMIQERGNASMSNLNYSPKRASPRKSLAAPSFVSPGSRKTESDRPSWKKSSSSSYLNKHKHIHVHEHEHEQTSGTPTGTPTQSAKPKLNAADTGFGFGGLAFSPSPGQKEKPKVNAKSWKGRLSFQAASPRELKKKTPTPSFGTPHYGGSYLDKSPRATAKPSRPHRVSGVAPLVETPDIKIEVKIPDIDKKIRARRAAARMSIKKEKEQNVPEHIRKIREREAKRIKKLEDKEHHAANMVQAYFLGWKARAAYPKLRKENEKRLQKIAQERAFQVFRIQSAIQIQKAFRGYLPRQRFRFLIQCKQRREKNMKAIKQIQKEINKIPKKTKADIKLLKKEYSEKKKDIKKKLRNTLAEEDKQLEEFKRSGHDMMKYMQDQNKKVKEQQQAFKNEYRVLEKQFELLTQKSDEIANNFQSLHHFVKKKNASIQTHEINSQKCRHRYLPKHRADIADRNKHCVAEYRVKGLYKERLDLIVKEIVRKSSQDELVYGAQDALNSLEDELKAIPELPIPAGLENWF